MRRKVGSSKISKGLGYNASVLGLALRMHEFARTDPQSDAVFGDWWSFSAHRLDIFTSC